MIPDASKELLEGCSNCQGHFFFFIRKERLAELKQKVPEIAQEEKKKVESDIREIIGITEETQPVILDLESIRVLSRGKFEIDIVKLFNKKRPLIYKLEEGKYIIDLASTFGSSLDKDSDKLDKVKI
jgi:predicted  nucleic acid-binding Zn-ribbon protein